MVEQYDHVIIIIIIIIKQGCITFIKSESKVFYIITKKSLLKISFVFLNFLFIKHSEKIWIVFYVNIMHHNCFQRL